MIGRLRQWFARPSAPASANPASDSPGDSPIDWRVGDVACCLHLGQWFRAGIYPGVGPQRGETRKVIAIAERRHPDTGDSIQLLQFSHYGEAFYLATCFVRIDPRAERLEAADAAFVASLKPARLPRREAAPAGHFVDPPHSSRVHAREAAAGTRP